MKTIHSFFFFLIFSLSLFADDAALVKYATKALPHYGVLTKKENGFTYLKVSDEYIHLLFDLIDDKGFSKPPYFRRADAPGAHVSVLYETEAKTMKAIPHLGEVFKFEIKEIARVNVKNQKEYIVLRVISPELEAYRQSLGLKPKLQGHDFHISIAVRKIAKKKLAE